MGLGGGGGGVSDDGPVYVAEILVNMTKESAKSRNTAMVKPCPPGERGEMQVLSCGRRAGVEGMVNI